MTRIEKHRQLLKDRGLKVVECHLSKEDIKKLEITSRYNGLSRTNFLSHVLKQYLNDTHFLLWLNDHIANLEKEKGIKHELFRSRARHSDGFTDYTLE